MDRPRRSARAERAPPIWSRHEPSTAVQYSAPLASIAEHLSATIAEEVAAFLIANVPPNPQHSSARSSSHELETADVPEAAATGRRRPW